MIAPPRKWSKGNIFGWNSWRCVEETGFTEEELKDFVNHCTANGQIPGVYWTPFTDWGKHPERTIKDAPDYKFQDVYLYANGQPQELDGAYAIDPTHPAIEEMMKKTSDLFRRCGFKYVKMDFMTHGAMEADKWYNPEIRTGIQGYNYGMQMCIRDRYILCLRFPVLVCNRHIAAITGQDCIGCWRSYHICYRRIYGRGAGLSG